MAVLIAILGSPASPAATVHVYQRASYVIAGIALAGGLTGLGLLRGRA